MNILQQVKQSLDDERQKAQHAAAVKKAVLWLEKRTPTERRAIADRALFIAANGNEPDMSQYTVLFDVDKAMPTDVRATMTLHALEVIDILDQLGFLEGPEPIAANYGPGPHPGTGTPQSVHGRGGMARWREDQNPKGGKAGNETEAFGVDPNNRYRFRTRLVDLGNLVTSNLDNGAVNPDYPQELQPRLRNRAASKTQVDAVARDLVPESLVWDFHSLQQGTPIVGGDNVVESGNGRTMALRKAAEAYPEKWAEYQEVLRQNLAEYGLTEADMAGMSNPVLVRERITDTDRAGFAREANSPPVLSMSPLEQARVDAARLTTNHLQRLQVGDDQTIDEALRTSANSDFVKAFTGTLSDNERATIMRSDGTLNRQGLWRIKAAVFSKVFPGEAGERLSEAFLESLDSGIKNFETALSGALPRLAHAENLIATGQRKRDLSMSGDLSRAVDMLARLRESKIKVSDYLAQGALFGRELTHNQERLLGHLDRVSRSPKAIRSLFERYAQTVIDQPDPNQMTMFGVGGLDYEQMLSKLLEVTE